MKRLITIFIVIGILGLVAFRLVSNKSVIASKTKVRDNKELKVTVNTAIVESQTSEKNLSLVGTVLANQIIDVKSEVAGKVTSLNVDLGDFVQKGKIIAHIDDKIRRLGLANAEQKLADAKQNLERYKNLYEGGAASKAQYDQYQLAFNNADNQLEQARKELSNTSVTAPISGFITQKSIEAGAFVNIASPLVTIVDISKLKVQLNVAEKDVYALNAGDKVKITSTVYPGVTFEGKITFISPNGDQAHNYPIEISLENQLKNPLKSGTYVDVTFNRKSTSPSLHIPREALVGSIKNARVYLVNEDSIAVLRNITIGSDNGAQLEVLKGLKEGDRVVTTGQINLSDSTEVAIIN